MLKWENGTQPVDTCILSPLISATEQNELCFPLPSLSKLHAKDRGGCTGTLVIRADKGSALKQLTF